MPLDSQGNYTPPAAPTFPAVAGTTIQAQHYNDVIQDMVATFNTMLLANGLRAMTGNLKMNNNRILNLPIAANSTEAVSQATMIQRTIYTSPNMALVRAGTPADLNVYANGTLQYTTGMTIITSFQNFVWSHAGRRDQVKFSVDGLPAIDFRTIGDKPVRHMHLGQTDTIMVRIEFESFPTPAFVARLVYARLNPINRIRGHIFPSAATAERIGQHVRMGLGVANAETEDQISVSALIEDAGELFSNSYRKQVGLASGSSYDVVTQYGRGLYVIESTGISWGVGATYCFFAEHGAGTIVLSNPLTSTSPGRMGAGQILQFPTGAAYQANLYKVF